MTYGPLLNGATVVVFEGVPTHPTPSRCWEVVDKYTHPHPHPYPLPATWHQDDAMTTAVTVTVTVTVTITVTVTVKISGLFLGVQVWGDGVLHRPHRDPCADAVRG